MTYTATCARIESLSKHPNADKLQLATVCGMQVIVGLDMTVGQLGLFFPPGGLMGVEFAAKHNLLKSQKGYLSDSKPCIEALKLRGMTSYGLFVPTDEYDEGDLVGDPVCTKYLPPNQPQRAIHGPGKAPKNPTYGLPCHYDTPQIWNVVKQIPVGARVFVTEKIHGTSGRSGLIKRPRKKGIIGWIKSFFQSEYVYVCGSRNVEFPLDRIPGVRGEVHRQLAPYIKPGEVWYYEIYGYDGHAKIQQDLRDNESLTNVSYTYGKAPGEYSVFVYRITDASGRELNPFEVDDCRLNVPTSSFFDKRWRVLRLFEHISASDTMKRLSYLANAPSFAPGTISEGVVAVFTDPTKEHVIGAAKLKSFKFCEMEGIAYGGDKYVDAEEAA